MPPNQPLLGAIAIVLKDRHVLLAQRGKQPDAGLWGFPGGHVELGETALAAATRELVEETGVIARPLGYLTNVDVLRHAPDGTVVTHYLLAAVLCDYISGTPQAADDVTDAAWFPIDDVRSGHLEMSDQVVDIMELALTRGQNLRC
ncbi:MAG: 8-oxo-dGTP diphosphatase [Paracoccaceae bacterium]|jgi:8-oxo-dGTP diphosphatase